MLEKKKRKNRQEREKIRRNSKRVWVCVGGRSPPARSDTEGRANTNGMREKPGRKGVTNEGKGVKRKKKYTRCHASIGEKIPKREREAAELTSFSALTCDLRAGNAIICNRKVAKHRFVGRGGRGVGKRETNVFNAVVQRDERAPPG